MTQEINQIRQENLTDFAKYLGVDSEDLYQLYYKNDDEEICFDDYSR